MAQAVLAHTHPRRFPYLLHTQTHIHLQLLFEIPKRHRFCLWSCECGHKPSFLWISISSSMKEQLGHCSKMKIIGSLKDGFH